jgi:Ca2+-binding RTX toxin-like protein
MADFPGTPDDDFIVGTSGDDTISGEAGEDSLRGLAGKDSIHGGDDDDFITGGDGNDELYGDAGNDYLRGEAGDDYIDGGDGYDRAAYFTFTSGVTVDLRLQGIAQNTGWGMDTLVNIENLSGTAYADILHGDDNDNWVWSDGPTGGLTPTNDNLYGHGGNDLIETGSGDHILDGGDGIDAVSFGQPLDIIVIAPDPANGYGNGIVIDLLLQGAAQDTRQGMMTLIGFENVSGSILDDRLSGDNGANLIAGDAGNDILLGRGGNDTLYGDAAIGVQSNNGTSGPIALRPEDRGIGYDFYDSSGELVLIFTGQDLYDKDGNQLERTDEAGPPPYSLFRISPTEQILFRNGNSTGTDGFAGNDYIDGGAGDDGIFGGGGDDYLLGGGGTGVDRIEGGEGNDYIDGGAGGDTMTGGLGDDVYVVDSLSDIVTELRAEGTDEVRTAIGSKTAPDYALYVLPDFVEKLTGTAAGGQGVRGNSLDNVIVMAGGADLIVLDDGGADIVDAGGGNDYIYYGAAWTADDVTNGGGGTDTLGLLGNYSGVSAIVFTATNLVGVERLALYTGGGTNSYTVTTVDSNVASGTEFFVTAASLTAAETLIFNGSAETNGRFTVHGGAGADTISGGAGNDFLIGNAGADLLYGLGGADTLVGGLGADQLRGGAGADVFRYLAATDSATAGGVDQILDFRHVDRIDLSAIDSNGNSADGNTAFAFIGNSAFHSVAGELRAYQSGPVWMVEGDVNGDGTADLVIQVTLLDPGPMVAGDFVL